MRKGRVEPRRPVDVPPQFAPPELDFKFPISQPSAQKQTPPSPHPYSLSSAPNPHPGRGRCRGFSSNPRGSAQVRSKGDERMLAVIDNDIICHVLHMRPRECVPAMELHHPRLTCIPAQIA